MLLMAMVQGAVVLTTTSPQSQPLASCLISDLQSACYTSLGCFTTQVAPFHFTAPQLGRYLFTTTSTCSTPTLAILQPSLAKDDTVCTQGSSTIQVILAASQSIIVLVGSQADSCPGSTMVTLQVTFVPSPPSPTTSPTALVVYNLLPQPIEMGKVDEIIVVGSVRRFLMGANASIPTRPFMVLLDEPYFWPRGINFSSPVEVESGGGFFQLPMIADADRLENLQGTNANFFHANVTVMAQFTDGWEQERFFLKFPVDLQLVSIVVNPATYTYNLEIGQVYNSSTLSPLPISEVLNPLCSDSLNYTAQVCDPSILAFPNTTRTTGLIPPNQGVGNKLEFIVNLTSIPPSTNMQNRARNLTTCIQLYMSLDHMGVSFMRYITLDIKLLEICPPGTSSSSGTNELGCVPCMDRYYQELSGSTQCVPVSAGSEVAGNKSAMVPCPIGTYSNSITDKCTKCELGTYSDAMGSSVCKPCPSATLPATLFLGSTSLADCTTDERQDSYKSKAGLPEKCPVGAYCNFTGATVETIKLKPGFYRTGNQSLDIRECKSGFCEPPMGNSSSNRRQLDYQSVNDIEYCTPHHQGHLCEICEQGYIHRGPQRICQQCLAESQSSDSGRMAGIFFALALAAIAICSYITSRFYTYYKPQPFVSPEIKLDSPIKDEDHRFRTVACNKVSTFLQSIDIGGTPFKITIGYYQVVAGMALGLGEFLPKYFKQFADVFSLLSLDFVKVFDFGCSLPEQSHKSSLLFATLTPIGFILVLFMVEKIVMKRVVHKEALHVGFMNLYLWTLFLIYPSISKTIFQTFSCQTFDDGFSSIKIDPQIDCNSDTYRSLLAYGICCVILYVLGVPALFFYLLRKQRFQLDACPEFEAKVSLAYREKNVNVQSTRMLWHSYMPKRYNFEVFELGRKLFQTSVFVFVSQDSAAQVIFLLVTCAVVVVILSWMDPYVRQTHNALAQWSQWNIFTIAFVALLNRMNIATVNEQVALDMLLLVCLISVPIIALVIGIDWTWLLQWLSKAFARCSVLLRRTREFNKSDSFKPDASAVNQRLNDKIVHNAVEELEQSINSLADRIDQNTKDKMLIIIQGLDKKYREESEVSRVERSILLNDASEKGHLKKRVVELIEENDHLKYTKSYLEDQAKALGEQFEREVQHMSPGMQTRRVSAFASPPTAAVRKHRASIAESAKKVTDMFFFANPVSAGAAKEDIPLSHKQQSLVMTEPSVMFARVMADSVSSNESRSANNPQFAKTGSERKF
ncbi:hypothetical protein BASA81_001962 [Batrachochytrium salamandrivorans]|nr:hypothetical protein BASA81_001962 [Batrachochytrium salamandrivorans]